MDNTSRYYTTSIAAVFFESLYHTPVQYCQYLAKIDYSAFVLKNI